MNSKLVFAAAAYILAGLVVTLTALPFLRFGFWLVRIGDFPRIQIGVAGLLSILILFVLGRWAGYADLAVIAIVAVCVSYQVYCILPYTPLYATEVERSNAAEPKKSITVLISNVLIDNKDYSSLVLLIDKEKPDVVLLAEPDRRWLRQISKIEKEYIYTVKAPLDNAYGMALYSRFELIDPEIRFLVEEDIPSIHTGIKLPSGDILKFFGLHPRPPVPNESATSVERDAELVAVGKMIRKTSVPTIVAGDLNDVAWSRTTKLFQKVSGMIDPRVGRGLYSSFHADYPFLRFPLDHVFHTPDFRLVDLRRLPGIGSDHFPLIIELSLERDAKETQTEREANTSEMKQANKMLEEAEEKNDIEIPDDNESPDP